jgi:hypothetical protein
MTGNDLTPPTGNTPAVSLRDRSNADLTQAILSAGDEAYVLDRARVVLKLYYDPAMDDMDRADMLEEFRKALSHLPKWAVSKGFDEWARTMSRRPSPGEIGILAGRFLKSMTDELACRAKEASYPTAETPPRERSFDEKARTEVMLQKAGFTPKRMQALHARPMARTHDELFAERTDERLHWTETVAPDSPEMEQLRRARAANPLMNPQATAAE